jgi:hypothetical protein
MKKLLVSLLAALSLASYAEDKWIVVAKSNDGNYVYFSQKESIKIDVNASRLPIVIAKLRVASMKDKEVFDGLWYVTIADCKKAQGDITLVNSKGEYVDDIKFDFTEEDIASGVAQGMCKWAQKELNGEHKSGTSSPNDNSGLTHRKSI